jgi:hypothetical protein
MVPDSTGKLKLNSIPHMLLIFSGFGHALETSCEQEDHGRLPHHMQLYAVAHT